jgi:hypothetical protein
MAALHVSPAIQVPTQIKEELLFASIVPKELLNLQPNLLQQLLVLAVPKGLMQQLAPQHVVLNVLLGPIYTTTQINVQCVRQALIMILLDCLQPALSALLELPIQM